MANERNILGNRTRSATLVRVSVVLVIAGIALLLLGSMWQDAREGLIYTGGAALAIGVLTGIVGVFTARFERQ